MSAISIFWPLQRVFDVIDLKVVKRRSEWKKMMAENVFENGRHCTCHNWKCFNLHKIPFTDRMNDMLAVNWVKKKKEKKNNKFKFGISDFTEKNTKLIWCVNWNCFEIIFFIFIQLIITFRQKKKWNQFQSKWLKFKCMSSKLWNEKQFRMFNVVFVMGWKHLSSL